MSLLISSGGGSVEWTQTTTSLSHMFTPLQLLLCLSFRSISMCCVCSHSLAVWDERSQHGENPVGGSTPDTSEEIYWKVLSVFFCILFVAGWSSLTTLSPLSSAHFNWHYFFMTFVHHVEPDEHFQLTAAELSIICLLCHVFYIRRGIIPALWWCWCF